MPLLMACPTCRLRFPFNLIGVTGPGSLQVEVTGNRVNCPRCGDMAEQVVEGTFEVDSTGTWKLLRETVAKSRASAEELQALAAVLEVAKSQGMAAEQVAEAVARVSPKFKQLSELLLSGKAGSFYGLLAALIAVLAYFLPRTTEPSVAPPTPTVKVEIQAPASSDNLTEIVRRGIEEYERQHPQRCGKGPAEPPAQPGHGPRQS